MVPCIHPALLVPLLLGAGVIFDKTISVPAACLPKSGPTFFCLVCDLSCLGLSELNLPYIFMLTNH